jgi:hypothetical protein
MVWKLKRRTGPVIVHHHIKCDHNPSRGSQVRKFGRTDGHPYVHSLRIKKKTDITKKPWHIWSHMHKIVSKSLTCHKSHPRERYLHFNDRGSPCLWNVSNKTIRRHIPVTVTTSPDISHSEINTSLCAFRREPKTFVLWRRGRHNYV